MHAVKLDSSSRSNAALRFHGRDDLTFKGPCITLAGFKGASREDALGRGCSDKGAQTRIVWILF